MPTADVANGGIHIRYIPFVFSDRLTNVGRELQQFLELLRPTPVPLGLFRDTALVHLEA
ncbi:hypothetical protein LC608_34645 [Nostoc sp. XA010]|uniref:hypothetical protein n=1 Tax=Nostoc sp. XA010 TaxID=2780407 RepID=UPI001E4A29EC|nr:hypothetical protein [Nostoc sp. XA010]MCC5661985.1 hypothetical protein [Nostoc sp. XA010]